MKAILTLLLAFSLVNAASAGEYQGILKGFSIGDSGEYLEVVDANGKRIELGDATGATPWSGHISGGMPRKYKNKPITVYTDKSGAVTATTILGETTVSSKPISIKLMPGGQTKIGRVLAFSETGSGQFTMYLLSEDGRKFEGGSETIKPYPWGEVMPEKYLNAKVKVTLKKNSGTITKVDLIP